MLTIKEVIKTTKFGGTAPVFIVASDGSEYLMKFRMSDEGMDIQNFNEFLGYGIAKHLDLKISPQKIKIINIEELGFSLLEEAYKQGRITHESLKYASQSFGSNLGIERIYNIKKATEITNQTFLSKVRLVDNILMNRDRYKENPNILKDINKDNYYSIDYGLSLLECRIYEALEDDSINRHLLSLQSCDALKYDRYIFKGTSFKSKLDVKIFRDIIENLIDSMPKEWEPIKYKDFIADLLSTRFALKLQIMDSCPVELYK